MTNTISLYELIPGTVLSTNDHSIDLYVGTLSELLIGVDVTAIDAATTLKVFVETKMPDGNYFAVWTSADITATGLTSESIGAGLQTATSFGDQVRVRWTITASKTATLSLTLIGK